MIQRSQLYPVLKRATKEDSTELRYTVDYRQKSAREMGKLKNAIKICFFLLLLLVLLEHAPPLNTWLHNAVTVGLLSKG